MLLQVSGARTQQVCSQKSTHEARIPQCVTKVFRPSPSLESNMFAARLAADEAGLFGGQGLLFGVDDALNYKVLPCVVSQAQSFTSLWLTDPTLTIASFADVLRAGRYIFRPGTYGQFEGPQKVATDHHHPPVPNHDYLRYFTTKETSWTIWSQHAQPPKQHAMTPKCREVPHSAATPPLSLQPAR